LPGKYEYLMKVCALITSGEGNFEGSIELSQFMIALYYIKSPLTLADVWLLAEASNLCKIEVDEEKKKFKMIHFQPFLRALRRSLPELEPVFLDAKDEAFGITTKKLASLEGPIYDDLDSECSDEIDEGQVDTMMDSDLRARIAMIRMKCTALDHVEIDSFDGVDGGYLQDEPDSEVLLDKYQWQKNVRASGDVENADGKPTKFNDLTDDLLNFPSVPLMKRLDIYHTQDSVVGL
jgi:hypothetical protein